MGAPADFAQLCPSMRFAGSDMVRYRAASRQWNRIFSSFKGVTVMKRSIDEAYLDLTTATRQRIKAGHVHIPQPHHDPAALTAVATTRHSAATALYMKEEAALQARFGPLDAQLLESSGTIVAAVRASASTDPISQLREQQRVGMAGEADGWRMGKMELDERVQRMTEEEIQAMCEALHPVEFCRAQKAQRGPIELVKPDEATTTQGTAQGLQWRPWVGNVILAPDEDALPLDDGEEESAPLPAADVSDSLDSFPSTPLSPLYPPPVDFSLEDPDNPSDDYLMAVGSQVAFDMRTALFLQRGLTTSAGIAPNPMLAKLASSSHKPNQQSIVRRSIARAFIAPLKLSKVSGFGPKASERVEAAGLRTVQQVQQRSYASLVAEFGERFGEWLYAIGQGEDETAVEATGAPKSIGQSKRQKTVTEDERLNLLYWLASKLYERIAEDEREYGRYPSSLALGWINMGTWDIVSRRVTIPYLREKADPVQFLYEAAIDLLRTHAPPPPVPLRCLSLTASGFVLVPTAKAISSYFNRAKEEGEEREEAVPKEEKDGVETAAREVVPLTANPLVGPSFTARYRTAKALVKKKKAGGRLLKQQEKRRTLEQMVQRREMKVKQGEVLEVEAREGERRMECKEGEEEGSQPDGGEDEIASLFGDPPLSSIPSPPLPALEPSQPLPPPVALPPPSTFLCPQCHASLPLSSQTEHADWHYAQSLQSEVRAADRARREAEEEERRRARKERKERAGGLDRFVIPHSSLSPSPPSLSPAPHRVPSSGGVKAAKKTPPTGSISSFFRLHT